MNELDVKAIRKNLGITQKELAKKLGVSETTVQNWERGLTIPATKYSILSEMAGGMEGEQKMSSGSIAEDMEGVVIPECAMKLLSDKEASLHKAQEQIDRLLAVIENLTNKQ